MEQEEINISWEDNQQECSYELSRKIFDNSQIFDVISAKHFVITAKRLIVSTADTEKDGETEAKINKTVDPFNADESEVSFQQSDKMLQSNENQPIIK